MTKPKNQFETRAVEEQKIKIIKKFARGDFGVKPHRIQNNDFIYEAAEQEGLLDVLINNSST